MSSRSQSSQLHKNACTVPTRESSTRGFQSSFISSNTFLIAQPSVSASLYSSFPAIDPKPLNHRRCQRTHCPHHICLTFRVNRHFTKPPYQEIIFIMVKFSQAASVLLLALGTTAFVPSKLGNAGVRSSVNSGAVQKIESCDAKVGKYKLDFNFSPWCIFARAIRF